MKITNVLTCQLRVASRGIFVKPRPTLLPSFVRPASAQTYPTIHDRGIMTATEPSTSSSKRASSNDDIQDGPNNKKRSLNMDDTEEAITQEELEGTEPSVKASSSSEASTRPRNAFSELMSPKKPKPSPQPSYTKSSSSSKKSQSFRRDGLGVYLTNPSSPLFGSQIIFHTDSFVAIHDLYPKATVHALLLPRSSDLNRLHPFEALSSSEKNAEFLASVKENAARLKDLVAKELQRRLGRFSASEAKRNAILDGTSTAEDPPETDSAGNVILPTGRDWSKEVKIGVHAVPSMNHLHIHVLSRDMHSDRLKHRKHYNSFTTDFFVDLQDFPLAEDDWRLQRGAQQNWPERPMVCWRCGRDFGGRFKELKEHLEVEFEEWKRE